MKRKFIIPAKKTAAESIEQPPLKTGNAAENQGKAIKRKLEPEAATKENECPQRKAPKALKSLKVSEGKDRANLKSSYGHDNLVDPQPEEAPFFVIIGEHLQTYSM